MFGRQYPETARCGQLSDVVPALLLWDKRSQGLRIHAPLVYYGQGSADYGREWLGEEDVGKQARPFA